MYREPHQTFASTVERLETELRELRALRSIPRPRERVLWAITALSVLGAIFATAASVSIRESADDAERRFEGARTRLELKTQDLGACESFAQHVLARTN
jgi:aminoglycoside phosphotransferase (APT) family kinase protein